MADTELLCFEEVTVWNLIKKYPEELGFVLQEENYEKYVDSFAHGEFGEPILTEDEFNTLKTFFSKENR